MTSASSNSGQPSSSARILHEHSNLWPYVQPRVSTPATSLRASGTTGFLWKSQVQGPLRASQYQELGPHPALRASRFETRPERRRLHKTTATPRLLPPTPRLWYPSLQGTRGRSRAVGGRNPSHVPVPPGHSAGQVPTSPSAVLLLLPPPPNAEVHQTVSVPF